jgi:hypothetical protein
MMGAPLTSSASAWSSMDWKKKALKGRKEGRKEGRRIYG